MKKYVFFILLFAALVSCQKKDRSLEVSSHELSFDATAGVKNIKVDTEGSFSIDCQESDWYEINYSLAQGMGYGAVSVVVKKNRTASSRSGSFTIHNGAREQTISFTQNRPAVPATIAVTDKKMNRNPHSFTLDTLEDYECVLESDVDWISLEGSDAAGSWQVSVAPNTGETARTGRLSYKTTDGQNLSAVELRQVAENALAGEFLLEEIYYTGAGQFIRICNHTDETLYADGLLLCTSSYASNYSGAEDFWVPETYPEDAVGVHTAYRIPGTGAEVPVRPHESLTLAIRAADFADKGGLDLSDAHFAFYALDGDQAPLLTCWSDQGTEAFALDASGCESYALVCLPVTTTAEQFSTQYAWAGKEVLHSQGKTGETRSIGPGHYLIPNDYVIDAVNSAFAENLYKLAFNKEVDASYYGVSSPGVSMVRSRDEEGRCCDTNASARDFTSHSIGE